MKKWARIPFNRNIKDIAPKLVKLVADEWDTTVPQLLDFSAKPEFVIEPRRALIYILSMHGTGPSRNISDYFNITASRVREILPRARELMKDNPHFNKRCKSIYDLTKIEEVVA